MNASGSIFSAADTAVLAWAGQDPLYCLSTQQMLGTAVNDAQNPLSCHFLNGARTPVVPYMPTAAFSRLVQVVKEGVFTYISTRNNNFSNRSQKGVITATTPTAQLSAGAIVGIVLGTLAGLAVLVGVGYVVATRRVGKVGGSIRI